MRGQLKTSSGHDDRLAPVVQYVQSLLGVRLDGNRGEQLLGALEEAVRRDGASSPEEFLQHLEQDTAVLDDLTSVATVGETYFFRHPEQLATLTERVFPVLLAHRSPGRALRLWSAGCASGEEAYTLAMLAEDVGITQTKIFATDVSRRALAKAAAAVYRPWSLRGDDAHAQRFERVGDRFRVPERLTARVELRLLNLLHDPYPGDIDILLCRNVLMYLEPAHIQRVAERLAASLAPGGWLVTAPADPGLDFGGALEPIMTHGGVMYRRPGGRATPAEHRARTAEPRDRAVARPPVRRKDRADAGAEEAGRRICRPLPQADGSTPAHAVDALEALERGDHAAAADIARAVVAAGDDSPTMRAVWARALGNSGQIAAAEPVAAAGAAAFPLDAELRYLHAELLIEAGHFDAAAVQAAAAVYLDPALGVAHLVLGRAELARGRPDAARRAFRTAGKVLEALPARRMAGYAIAYEQLVDPERRRR